MQLFLMFLLALAPIIWLIIALTKFKMAGFKASIIALVIAFFLAILVWKMSLLDASSAALEGFAMALWPIILVIIAAVFTYNLTVYSGAMNTIKSMITSVSYDKRILVLLVGWCFGGFLEGIAGFGTAIAIPASMLCALGFQPVKAILVCLIANGMPTMFGSIGIPTVTLSNLTHLDPIILGFVQTIQATPLLFISPFLMVILTGKGFKSLKGITLLTTLSAISYILPEILVARFIGAELPVIVGSVCSLITTFAYAKYHSKKHPVPDAYRLEVEPQKEVIDLKKALYAWAPFILIFILLLLTSKMVPFIYEPLNSIQSSVLIYTGENATPYTFVWIATPGILIFLSGFIGGRIQKVSLAGMLHVLKDTCIQMSKTVVTMLSVLGTAKIMGYSGMITSISELLVTAMKSFYPLVAPVLGALGTFVTGSGTSSEVLFGNVQMEAAKAIHANEYWLAAANSLGVGVGKMLSPQSIAIGCAATSLSGKDGEILKKIAKYAFIYLIIMAFIIYFGDPIVDLII
ncbi:lactate permease [Breznakia sp. PF5-3]|uniref:L-lactate permease n=1 Tax=unclassified Breznakia TaxID=2623764 RepID=UPI0024074FA5|nr:MULTISPECIES: L-lactate permease [unclassified Breznakia]MDF9825103.1 lactate permease [Breznakia sp. PM6-1]MDF9835920.1 lactate permease [Breznakia sp. PF5-3]MDF9837478.1 lactate permease [Breznakia sp. PFB2-8]MDF9859459.1 lactate permease [Breznakia sp. PH5-24]